MKIAKKICYYMWFFISMLDSSMEAFQGSKAEQAVNNVMDKMAQAVQKKYHMSPCGTSVSMPGGDVKELGLEYDINGPLSKEELREILINLAREFLNVINSDEAVRPYLTKYPFDMNNVQSTLYVMDSQGYDVNEPNIGTASIDSNKLFYNYWQKKK